MIRQANWPSRTASSTLKQAQSVTLWIHSFAATILDPMLYKFLQDLPRLPVLTLRRLLPAATLRARRQSSASYSDSGDVTPVRPMRSSAKGKSAARAKAQAQAERKSSRPSSWHVLPEPIRLRTSFRRRGVVGRRTVYTAHPAWRGLWKSREMVAAREISPDVWFKFKDKSPEYVSPDEWLIFQSRFAQGTLGTTYIRRNSSIFLCHRSAKNNRMFKVADICQVRPPLVNVGLPAS